MLLTVLFLLLRDWRDSSIGTSFYCRFLPAVKSGHIADDRLLSPKSVPLYGDPEKIPHKPYRFMGAPRKYPKKTMFFRGTRNELIKIYLFKFPKNDKKQREKKAVDFALFKCGNKGAYLVVCD